MPVQKHAIDLPDHSRLAYHHAHVSVLILFIAQEAAVCHGHLFDKAVVSNPDAHSLFHRDGGFQYTNQDFHMKLEQAGMLQSMPRVGKYI